MKRGAEKQLVKDAFDDDSNEDESPSQGFKKADEAVLAARPMRGLPKRVTTSTPTPANPSAPASTPKFGGFNGFGIAGSSGSFSSMSPANPLSTPSDAQTLNSTPLFSSPSTPFASTPSVSATAPNAVKTFASLLSTPASAAQPSDVFEKRTTLPEAPPSSSNQTEMADDPAELKYYTSLRGLNVSLLTAVSKSIEDDPLFDMGELLERYKNLRTTLKQNLEEKSDSISPSSSSTPAVPPAKPLGMPAPPSTFSGFSGFGSQPAPSFPTSNPTASSSTPSSNTFSFATPPSNSGSQSQKESSTTSSHPIGFSSTSTSAAFGTSSASSTSPFSLPAASSSKLASSSTQHIFGSSTPSMTSNLFGNTDKASTNIFGNATSASTTTNFGGAFGGFGGFKPAGGNIGNPVGYGFGTSKSSDADHGGQVTASNTTPVFNPFGLSTEKKLDGDVDDSAESGQSLGDETTGSKAQTPEVNNNSELLTSNKQHDEEGEGEEDEDTVHSVKLKAYRMRKADEKGGAGWAELGYGVLRLKKHKETGARRVLLRNSSSGKININFNIYSGLKPSQAKKALTFVGHSNGASQTYSVRLQTEGQATELKEALDREIAHTQAKGS